MSLLSYVPFAQRLLPAPVRGGFRMEDYWVWCGSAIRGEDGRYHLFAARWPRQYPFMPGYQSYSEVVRAVSDTPGGPYTFAEVVLPDRGGAFWDGRMTHNPTVLKRGDTYYLFYIGATYQGDGPTAEALAGADMLPWYQTIRIGMATAPSVLGPWTRADRPILEPGAWEGRVVTNPAPCLAPDGRLFLYYRANTPEGCRIGLAIAEEIGGPWVWRSEAPVVPWPRMEDPYVFWVDGHVEMLVKDLSGALTGEFGRGIHLLSPDGRHWHLADPPAAYGLEVCWDDGRRVRQGAVERPQLLMVDGVPAYLYAAMADGPGGFRAASETWTGVVPLDRGARPTASIVLS